MRMDQPRHFGSRLQGVPESPSERLAGRFRIVRWLGEGGMGSVYLAHDEQLDRLVAVKVLLASDPDSLTRFKQEFRTLADISHPNLIVLHELFCEQSAWLFTMDYVEGRDFLSHVSALEGRDAPTLLEIEATQLRELVREGDARAPRCALRSEAVLRDALLQLTDAIAWLHAAGKLHLDLKPSNVLVSADDHVTVLDFGLARDLDQSAAISSQRLLGTPAYIAPEHTEGKRFEPASDWYAIGVMLYEALTARLPFEGPVAHVLLSKATRMPEPPSSLCRDVPAHLEQLCMGLLARDPRVRAGATEILSVLGAAPAGARLARRDAEGREPLHGREQLLAQLAARAEARSAPRVILLHGPSGIGKTALARRFLDELASRPRALVLRGTCREREAMPYKAFDGIIDALIGALSELAPLELGALLPRHANTLVRLFPAFARVAPPLAGSVRDDDDPELGRARAFRAFGELFARLSDQFEVTLFLDDLHWADLDSALLSRALFRAEEPVPLLLIGTYREDVARDNPMITALRELGSDAARVMVDELAIGELAPDAAQALARTLLADFGRADEALAARIADEARGLPLFIQELVRHVNRGAAQPAQVSLGEVLAERIEKLPSDAAALLEVLAVAGAPIGLRAALRAARLGPRAGAALHTLRVAGLAKSSGAGAEDALEAAHDRIRVAAAALLTPERRRALHAALLAALELEPTLEEEQLYRHSLGGGLHASALRYAEGAGARAQRALAFHRSAELYRSALALEREQPERDPARRARLLEGLGDALAAIGHCLDAASAFLDAAALAAADVLPALERKAADQLLRGGDLTRGTELLARVLERVGVSYPRSARAALAALAIERARLFARGLSFEERTPALIAEGQLERLASLKVSLGVYWLLEPVRGALFATIYLRDALDAGHARHVLRGLEVEAAYVSLLGGARGEARAQALYDAARKLTARIGRATTETGYKLAEAGFHAIYGRKRESTECALRALAARDRQGLSWERAYARFHVYQNTLYIGGRRGLSMEIAEHVADAERRRDRFAAALLLPMLALAQLMADEPQLAHASLARMRPMLNPELFCFLDMQELIWSALTHQYQGHSAQALARYQEAKERYALSGMMRLSTWRLLHQWGSMLAHLAALAEGGDRRVHARAAQQRIRTIERERIAWPLPFAAMGRASLHHMAGEHAPRDRQLLRAIRESEALGYLPFTLLFSRSAALFRQDAEAVARYESELVSLGIAAPRRWQHTWAPGLTP